jgi:hypothetical protein
MNKVRSLILNRVSRHSSSSSQRHWKPLKWITASTLTTTGLLGLQYFTSSEEFGTLLLSLQDSKDSQCHNNTMKGQTQTETAEGVPHLNVLLTNGRFPVAIDLARQLRLAGHTIFAVDPMQFHACKASNVVEKSFRVSAPRENAAGYIAAVKHTVKTEQIDLIIPLHEEIFHLADCNDRDILDRY